MDKKQQGLAKRRATMLEKHGGEAGLKAYYQELQKKSRKNYKGTGGFRALSEERRKEISRKGILARGDTPREKKD